MHAAGGEQLRVDRVRELLLVGLEGCHGLVVEEREPVAPAALDDRMRCEPAALATAALAARVLRMPAQLISCASEALSMPSAAACERK